MKPYFLNPLLKETSPYGVDVCKSLQDFIDHSDKELLDKYLKSVCLELAVILKRQRGDDYGFGDNPDSPAHVTKQMTDELLDNPSATHTKSIENYFGRLDGLLKTATPKGFLKSVDDLIITYSADLINSGEWRTKAVRKTAQELKKLEKAFGQSQEELLTTTNDAEAALVVQDNKVLKLVSKMKESHDGPITTLEELNRVTEKYKDKELDKILTLEIRFRKMTSTKVKSACPLFKQRNITQELKLMNLKSLVSASLNCSTSAEFEDLENAIIAKSLTIPTPAPAPILAPAPIQAPIQEETGPDTAEDQIVPVAVPMAVGTFVAVLCEDDFYIGEIILTGTSAIKVSFMARLNTSGSNKNKHWIFPSRKDEHNIEMSSVLEVYPQLDPNIGMSSARVVVMDLINFKIIEKFA